MCWLRESVEPTHWETDVDIMSESDWRLAQCEPGNPDALCLFAIERIAELFDSAAGKQWGNLCRTARNLIERARLA
jgi:hypothetical protein